MPTLSPIPTPPAQRWRETRLIYLPRVTFAVVAIAAALLWARWVSPATIIAEAESEKDDVRSRETGVVVNLRVSARQLVHAGDVLGQIVVKPAEAPAADAPRATPKLVPFVAPISGVVIRVRRHDGDAVTAGDKILKIESTHPKRLVGYMMQPLPFEPKPGATVEIRTRSFPRQTAITSIEQVGETMEPVSPNLLGAMRLPLKPTPAMALKIYLAMPAHLAVRPGEQVDVMIR